MVATKAFDEIIDFLAGYEPERLLNFHPSEQNQARVELLLERRQNHPLSESEDSKPACLSMLEYTIRLAKPRALKKMVL